MAEKEKRNGFFRKKHSSLLPSSSSSSSTSCFLLSVLTLFALISPTRSFRPNNGKYTQYDYSPRYTTNPTVTALTFSKGWKSGNGCNKSKQQILMASSSSSVVPVTYKSVNLKNRKILARSDAADILSTLKEWSSTDTSDEDKINSWMNQGLVFWLDDNSADSSVELVSLESINDDATSNSQSQFESTGIANNELELVDGEDNNDGVIEGVPNKAYTTADVYINLDKDDSDTLLLLKASKANLASKLKSDEDLTRELVEKGEIFTNMEWFFEDRAITRKGTEIATRMNNEFSLDSEEWKLWTSKTDKYNTTSLTQVFGEYFRDHSIGDNGGIDVSDAVYISKPGYPGTLAPGTEFKQDADINDLPNYILHPWPAMQEIKVHGRNPPAHPMIPPPLLWFAMNDMYTQNFTDWQLNEPSTEVVGGYMMEPKDAIRIARYHKIGLSYEPEDQLEHGGMIFEGGIGGTIPNYNPDHGPTVSEEEAATPIPDHLKSIANRWMDPYYQLDITLTNSLASAEEEESVKEEETVRRLAAEKKIAEFSREINPIKQETLPSIRKDVSTLHSRSLKDSKALYYDKIKRGNAGEISITDEEFENLKSIDEDDDLETILAQEMKEREEVVKTTINHLDEVAAGKSRGRKQLVGYAIETIRDMQAEISRAERDMATKKKSGRRKQKRSNAEADEFVKANLPEGEAENKEGEGNKAEEENDINMTSSD